MVYSMPGESPASFTTKPHLFLMIMQQGNLFFLGCSQKSDSKIANDLSGVQAASQDLMGETTHPNPHSFPDLCPSASRKGRTLTVSTVLQGATGAARSMELPLSQVHFRGT